MLGAGRRGTFVVGGGVGEERQGGVGGTLEVVQGDDVLEPVGHLWW